mgnify:CR=1 FL=1
MKRPRMEVNLPELDRLLEEATSAPLAVADSDKIKNALHAMAELIEARRRSAGRTTEKTAAVFPETAKKPDSGEEGGKKPGHGRKAASAYTGAEKIAVAHPELKHKDPCPECGQGKVYQQKEPRVLVRITGQAPLTAKVWELERLRCNACGQTYTAPSPEGVGEDKYDERAVAMLGLLKYGSGMPLARSSLLEEMTGVPLAESTQWELLDGGAEVLKAAGDELIRQAAQGEIFHNDDTGMRVLKLERPAGDARTGVFTTAVVSVVGERRIALFFTGRNHAGENFAEVLKERSRELAAPVQMCDALSRNVPKGVELLVANCLAHGRRQFVEVAGSFPEACRHVLVELGQVYAVEARARGHKLPPAERLALHQAESGPVMAELEKWCHAQFAQKLVEPNSSLGKAIQYLLNHWKKLTLFLRVAGAPLDNNICEQALKRVVLHRKNALFYKTMHGAETGDLYMSLIQTCSLNEVNAFEYLTALLEHPLEVRAEPGAWMPWNYADRLAA